jgi:hypothetical protein
MLRVMPAQQHSQGSRPDRCHPVGDRQLAQVQDLGGESRGRLRSHASRPRRAVGQEPTPRHESNHRP